MWLPFMGQARLGHLTAPLLATSLMGWKMNPTCQTSQAFTHRPENLYLTSGWHFWMGGHRSYSDDSYRIRLMGRVEPSLLHRCGLAMARHCWSYRMATSVW